MMNRRLNLQATTPECVCPRCTLYAFPIPKKGGFKNVPRGPPRRRKEAELELLDSRKVAADVRRRISTQVCEPASYPAKRFPIPKGLYHSAQVCEPASYPAKGFPIPKGLYHSAQGCELASYPGK